MSDTKMKVLDLFSGIGGFSLGLERAGMETVAFCEIEKFPQDVLKKHWPETPLFPDVKLLNAKMLPEKIDLICGGFPCQDISVAGKKKGLIDESGNTTRSGLWFEFKRLIKEIYPRYVIIENVANLRSNGLATVIKDLWEIGYGCEWHIISARSVGACHLRERIWIIAYPNCITVRDKSKRTQAGRFNIQTERERVIGDNGKEQQIESSNSNNTGRREYMRSSTEISELSPIELCGNRPSEGVDQSSNTNHLRLWKSFATEEEKQQWWTEATASFSDWWQVESPICGVHDGVSRGLDKGRVKRIKSLGNTIVPQIAELIGTCIINYEKEIANESK